MICWPYVQSSSKWVTALLQLLELLSGNHAVYCRFDYFLHCSQLRLVGFYLFSWLFPALCFATLAILLT